MNPFQRRRLGRTGLTLTALGLGGSSVGNLNRPVAEADGADAIEAALDAGIGYFDTAPLYGNGIGEHRMGRVLRRRRRDSFVLSSKVGRLLRRLDPKGGDIEPDPHGLPFQVVYDYSYDGVMRSIEDSLQRLGMNRIDIALIHDIDAHTHGEAGQMQRFREAMQGAYPALEQLRDDGTIQALGVGVNDWRVCQACLDWAEFDCFMLAGRYTLLEQGALRRFLPTCEQRGVGVIVGAPFNSGILARGAVEGAIYNGAKAPWAVVAKIGRIERVCRRHGVSLAAAALRFPLGHPVVASVIPGVRSKAHVCRNIKLFEALIPDDLWLELQHQGLIDAEAPIPQAG